MSTVINCASENRFFQIPPYRNRIQKAQIMPVLSITHKQV